MTTPQRIGRYPGPEVRRHRWLCHRLPGSGPSAGPGIALKVPHPHMAGKPQYLERCMREARLAASINHPNITIYAVGQEGNSHFIVME